MDQAFAADAREPVREDQVLGLSIWKLAIIGGIIVLLFGKGKISGMMGDLAQGIKSFKKGMTEDDTAKALDEKAEGVVSPMKEKASG
jgi:sec-independent protein translocase protein TatA